MRAILVSLAAAAMPLTSFTLATPALAHSQQETVDGRAVAAEVKRLLDQHYVLPDLRSKFAAVLDKGIASGRYDVAEPEQLVERLNADLATVTPDKHLGVMYDPKTSAELASAPPNAGADDAPATEAEITAAGRLNHGISQLRLLPGNIRYLESEGFIWAGDSTERAYDDAIRFLAGGDAIIIDMRKNGGGSPDAVRYLTSHFVKPNTPLMTFYLGARGTNKSTALPALRAPSLAGKPLYVLTSGGSASAAEEFIGHVAGFKLGELVGEKTAGAGFRNEFFPLPSGLIISVSVGQAILASTGKGWEAVGFAPETTTPVEKALEVATAKALARIAETAAPERAKALRASAALMLAKVNPVKTALPAAAYAGTFGERTVKLEGDKLIFKRDGGQPLELVAIGPNQFAFADLPGSTVSFDVDARQAIALRLVRGDGTTVEAPRNP